jgi:hypothetical protein
MFARRSRKPSLAAKPRHDLFPLRRIKTVSPHPELESQSQIRRNLEASVRSARQHCVRTVADLIEAGLNEDAGRFAGEAMGFV